MLVNQESSSSRAAVFLGVPLTKDPDDFAQISSFNEVGGNPGSPRIQVYWQYTRRLMGGSIYLKMIRLPWRIFRSQALKVLFVACSGLPTLQVGCRTTRPGIYSFDNFPSLIATFQNP